SLPPHNANGQYDRAVALAVVFRLTAGSLGRKVKQLSGNAPIRSRYLREIDACDRGVAVRPSIPGKRMGTRGRVFRGGVSNEPSGHVEDLEGNHPLALRREGDLLSSGRLLACCDLKRASRRQVWNPGIKDQKAVADIARIDKTVGADDGTP